LVPGEWLLHWDNAQVHTAQKVQQFLAKKQIQFLSHPPPISPNLAPAVLFTRLKRELAVLTLSLDEFKTKWEGVIRTLTKDDFTKVFQMCIEINGYYVEKS
jgi:hypothetical protein